MDRASMHLTLQASYTAVIMVIIQVLLTKLSSGLLPSRNTGQHEQLCALIIQHNVYLQDPISPEWVEPPGDLTLSGPYSRFGLHSNFLSSRQWMQLRPQRDGVSVSAYRQPWENLICCLCIQMIWTCVPVVLRADEGKKVSDGRMTDMTYDIRIIPTKKAKRAGKYQRHRRHTASIRAVTVLGFWTQWSNLRSLCKESCGCMRVHVSCFCCTTTWHALFNVRWTYQRVF